MLLLTRSQKAQSVYFWTKAAEEAKLKAAWEAAETARVEWVAVAEAGAEVLAVAFAEWMEAVKAEAEATGGE